MNLRTRNGAQDLQDAPLSERIAAWIVAQDHQRPARHTRPRIGILSYSGYLRDGGWPVYAGDAPTVHAILEAGGFPSLLPTLPLIEGYDPFHLLSDDQTFEVVFELLWPLVRDLDGLVLTGGGDLYSSLYRQSPHPQTESPDVWRDVWERYAALLAWLLCIPTLGICRGMQLMNVVLGGTLYQDLQTEWPKDRPPLLRHRTRGRLSPSAWITHPVHLHHRASHLAEAVRGKGELDRHSLDPVLSMHHQAIEMLAPGLIVSASSPEGVIEAFEDSASYRWWVGVQFHPEWMTQVSWPRSLFTALIEASRVYSAIPREELELFCDEIQGWLRQRDWAVIHRSMPQSLFSGTHTSVQTFSLPHTYGRSSHE